MANWTVGITDDGSHEVVLIQKNRKGKRKTHFFHADQAESLASDLLQGVVAIRSGEIPASWPAFRYPDDK